MACFIEVISHLSVAHRDAFMTAKGIMVVYQCSQIYVTIANFGMADVHFLKHQKCGIDTIAPQETVHSKDERFLSPAGAHGNNSTNSAYAVHYKQTTDRLEQTAEHETLKEEDESNLKKDWPEDVQLPVRFKTSRPEFINMLGTFESMSDDHLERINAARHRIDLLNDEVRSVHSALYRAGPTARQFAAAEGNRLIAKKVIEPITTE